ncbi:MAG: glycosyltransferase family 4 protein [Pseudomonadales bacterium]|nr:glycosyltransferase family 4 protein [Pseudomonadales bacterium]
MHIAFSIFKYFPFGGIQRDFIRMAGLCHEHGHQVRVYSLIWDAPAVDEFEVVLVPVKAISNHVLYERFAHWVGRDLALHPVDLHMGMNKIPGLDAYFAGDSCFEDKTRTQRAWYYRLTPRYRLFSKFEKAVFAENSSTRILSISDMQKELYQKYHKTPDSRFYSLPPGIHKNRIAPENQAEIRSKLRAEFSIPEGRNIILFIGSGFLKKGLDRAIRGLSALPAEVRENTLLLVLGKDKPDKFQRLAKSLGVQEQVWMLGGREDANRFLFSADCFVLPAYDENTGGVIVEALVARLPTLVSANCGYAEYVKSADAGLIADSPFSQRDFNAKLLELITSPRRAEWSENGRCFSERKDIYQMIPTAVEYLESFAEQIKTEKSRL